MVNAQMILIQDIQTAEWWRDVTPAMLESARLKLRALIKLIEKQRRKPVYTDFADQLGAETEVVLPAFVTADGFARFREKARTFLRAHLDHLSVQKLRLNQPLTPLDLAELERMLAESGVGAPDLLAKAKTDSEGLGLFVRSLVGLDREAAKLALGRFTAGKTLTANQIESVDLVVDHLTADGAMKPELLYESPFTDLAPQGPDTIFPPRQVDELVRLIQELRARAVV